MGLCQLLKEECEKNKFFLKHLEMEIDLPPYIRVRYYSPCLTLEDIIENSIKKPSDKILEKMTSEYRKRGLIPTDQSLVGAVKREYKNGVIYLEIILPSVFQRIDQLGSLLFGYLSYEFICSHEEAHVLQYTLNYTKLAQFIEKYVGRNPYLNEIYQRARCFDGIDNNKSIHEIEHNIERFGEACTPHRCYTKEEFKNFIQTDANICGAANLVRKGMIKVDNVNEILKPGFEFYELIENLKKSRDRISVEEIFKEFYSK